MDAENLRVPTAHDSISLRADRATDDAIILFYIAADDLAAFAIHAAT